MTSTRDLQQAQRLYSTRMTRLERECGVLSCRDIVTSSLAVDRSSAVSTHWTDAMQTALSLSSLPKATQH